MSFSPLYRHRPYVLAPTTNHGLRTTDYEPRTEVKIVVLTAPSGAGKTTIARRLLEAVPAVRFSVSATTRAPRDGEQDGVDYFFLSTDAFRRRLRDGHFIEYQEVYPGLLYGTLRAEIERVAADGAALLDIDVKGALNVKRLYGDRCLTIFVQPPSLTVLADRLRGRETETDASLAERLERAKLELAYAPEFDAVVVNDDLETAVEETVSLVRTFLAD